MSQRCIIGIFLLSSNFILSEADDDMISTGYHRTHEGGEKGTDKRLFRWITIAAGYTAMLGLALAISSGLYLLAEVAEEYSAMSKKVITILIYVTVSIHVIFLLLGLPFKPLLVGLVSHAVYYNLLSNFPYVELSVWSIGSLICLFANHYFWFQFFYEFYVPIFQITGFFLILVWAVPLSLFCSMSLGDDVLPAGSGGELHGQKRGGKNNIFMVLWEMCRSFLGNNKPAGLGKYN